MTKIDLLENYQIFADFKHKNCDIFVPTPPFLYLKVQNRITYCAALTALTGVLCLSSKNKNKAVKAVSQSQRMLRFKLAIWKAPLPIFRREDQSVFSEVEILIVESLIGIQ